MTHPESGKAARPEPIVDRILDELEEIGLGREMGSMNSMSWDEPRDRRLIREAFDDGGSGEAILPGFGATGRAENARDNCGKPHPHVCDSCGQSVEFGRTCAMSVCCRCARVWARDTGIRKSAKVRRVRIEEEKSLELWQKLHHLVISPPPGWFYDLARNGYSREEALEITRDVVKSILDELRAQGLLVRHSYRGAREDGSIKSEMDDRGEWKNRLFDGREWFGDVRDELAWKPHFHAIVVSDFIRVRADDDGPSLTEVLKDERDRLRRRLGQQGRGVEPIDGYVEFLEDEDVQAVIQEAKDQDYPAPKYVKGIIATILDEQGPVSYEDVAERIGASRMNEVSSAATTLESFGVVEKEQTSDGVMVDFNVDGLNEIREKAEARRRTGEIMNSI